MGFPTRYAFEEGPDYDESQDAFLFVIYEDSRSFKPSKESVVIKRGHDWSHYTEIENQDLYNMLYMIRDGGGEGAQADLVTDLYSDLKDYRRENDIF